MQIRDEKRYHARVRDRGGVQDHDMGGVNLAIIVTPMLDMAFQLLAFFVMTYHPSALEGSYKISQVLPPEKKRQRKRPSGFS